MNSFYTREFEIYAEETLREYEVSFFRNKDNSGTANPEQVLAFSRNLISFTQKLNQKALYLHAEASLINPDYSNNSKQNVFTLGKEYIRKFTMLYKH